MDEKNGDVGLSREACGAGRKNGPRERLFPLTSLGERKDLP
jgi:hypothetical protein